MIRAAVGDRQKQGDRQESTSMNSGRVIGRAAGTQRQGATRGDSARGVSSGRKPGSNTRTTFYKMLFRKVTTGHTKDVAERSWVDGEGLHAGKAR